MPRPGRVCVAGGAFRVPMPSPDGFRSSVSLRLWSIRVLNRASALYFQDPFSATFSVLTELIPNPSRRWMPEETCGGALMLGGKGPLFLYCCRVLSSWPHISSLSKSELEALRVLSADLSYPLWPWFPQCFYMVDAL